MAVGILFFFSVMTSVPGAPKLDPEVDKPFVWRTVVHFEPHPLFTKTFRAKTLNDLKSILATASGGVCKTETIEIDAIPEAARDATLKLFATRNWKWNQLDSEELRRNLSGIKTHYLRLSVKNRKIVLEARQFDGFVGLPSPRVRTREMEESESADSIVREAALLVEKDFGPTGTIERLDDAEFVKVTFRNGVAKATEKQIGRGDILAVARILENSSPPPPRGAKNSLPEPPTRHSRPSEFTLLRVEAVPVDGVCKCRVFTRFVDPFKPPRGQMAGWRCVKLTTMESRVTVKVADPSGSTPAGTVELLQVRANDIEYGNHSDPRDTFELRAGQFRSTRTMKNIALIRVSLGTTQTEERFPVPVTSDTPITLLYVMDKEKAAKAAYERECSELRGRVAELSLAQNSLVRAMTRLLVGGRNAEALERTTSSLKTIKASETELTTELERLKQSPLANERGAALHLVDANDKLKSIRDGYGIIESRLKELSETVGKGADPAAVEREFHARELNSRIKQLVESGEVPEALELYDQLYDVVKDDKIKKRKEALAEDWKTHNDEHKQARDFILDPWRRAVTLAEFRAALGKLKPAIEVLKKNEDRYGLRNLLASYEHAYAKLKVILDTLDGASEADRPALEELQMVSDSLRNLEEITRSTIRAVEKKRETDGVK